MNRKRSDLLKATDPVRVITLLVPGACPDLPTGPHAEEPEELGPYVIRHGALPPHCTPQRRLTFECHREDAVLILWRPRSTRNERATARTWLRRHGLDDHGAPLAVPSEPTEPAQTPTPAG